MSDRAPAPSFPQPVSLTGHVVPEDRLALIRQHVAALSAAALTVSDTLALGADTSEMVRVLEAEEERT